MRRNCILRSRLTFTRRIVSSPVVLRSWKQPLYICANLPFYLHRCSCPRFFVPLFFLIACFTGTLLSYHFFFDSVSLLQLHFRFRFPIHFCICDIHISQFLSSSSLSSVLISSSLSLSSSFHNFIDSLLRFEQRDGVAV